MTDVPFSNADAFFKGAERQPEPWPIGRPPPDFTDRNTCRWCLEKFDISEQIRSTRERGYLRTNLRMADNGSELVCCEACWQAAIGARTLIQGRVVPSDPEVIDNPLLRVLKPMEGVSS